MNDELKDKLYNRFVKSELDKILFKKLNDIRDNYHFAFGVLDYLDTKDKKQEMLNILNEGLNKTDEILLQAMALERNVDVETMKYMLDWNNIKGNQEEE